MGAESERLLGVSSPVRSLGPLHGRQIVTIEHLWHLPQPASWPAEHSIDPMVASRNGANVPLLYHDPVALRCLIVDDNPRFLQAARALLEQEGIRVVGLASTRAEAVGCTADLHPDVTLLDIDLGDDSGFDVARALVDDPRADPGHLILVSAYAEDEFVDLIEASPAIGFVRKPALSAEAIYRLLRAAGDAGRERGQTAES